MRLLLVVALVGASASGAFTARAHGGSLQAGEAAFLEAINDVRAAHGLPRLAIDPRLARAARFHSRRMLATDTMAHGDFKSRMLRFGVPGRVMAENLAWGAGSRGTPAAIVQAWLASPHHRANLLLPRFRHIGIGSAHGSFAGYSDAMVVTVDLSGR